MKKAMRRLVVVTSFLLVAGGLTAGPNSPEEEAAAVKAFLIPCKGLIDDGLYQSVQRRSQMALDRGGEYLIYEIGTYGGLLKSADDISKYFIFEVGKKARTVAYVATEAISAGAMISVSCQDIIMLENTTIGDCAPITLPGKELTGVEREKAESFTRAAFDRAAKANGYPQALLRAMVTMHIEVYKVKNLETGEFEYFEGDLLPTDANGYDLEGKKRVLADDQLLTVVASDALEYGIARAEVEGIGEALEFLAERDGVTFEGEPPILYTNWSEKMVRWLNRPEVMGILVMLALLGVYVEFNTPGVGLPGLVAVICFAIIIGSKYLVGMANWVEAALFFVGLVLLMVEIFVLPGFGIAGFSGILFILAGLFGMLVKNRPDELPWPTTTLDWELFANGALGLLIGVVGFGILAWVLSKYLPRLEVFSGLSLAPAAAKFGTEVEVSMTAGPDSRAVRIDVGDLGEVVSRLRPAGKVRFGDCVVDCVAEGDFLDVGSKVKIIEVRGNRVVVKRAEDQS